MPYPNRVEWRAIELVIVTVAIAWLLSSPTADYPTRLSVGLAIFTVMLVVRHFRPS